MARAIAARGVRRYIYFLDICYSHRVLSGKFKRAQLDLRRARTRVSGRYGRI